MVWVTAPTAPRPMGASLEAITDQEYQFWNAYYNIVPGTDSDWYSRLKGAAINMLALHDFDQGTGFAVPYFYAAGMFFGLRQSETAGTAGDYVFSIFRETDRVNICFRG